MRRGLVHTGAWALATGAAIALSWYGVHAVLTGTAYDPPRAMPISAADQTAGPATSSPPESSSTHRPKPPSPSASPSPSPSPSPSTSQPPPAPSPSATSPVADPPEGTVGEVAGYTLSGGRVAIALSSSSAALVSATPNSGWSMQVWKQNGWLRVDFTSGSGTSSVICTWNGHPPIVRTEES